MKTIQLKICGMRDEANILAIASMRPQYMGFIFYDKSPRYVGLDFAIPDTFPDEIKRVGVFVNASNDEIVKQTERLNLEYVQLHGRESVEQVQTLKSIGVKVIKVFSMDDDFDFAITQPYKAFVDFFLFDTKGKFYGGNSEAFDWELLKQYDQDIPFFLSGGLAAENVAAVRALQNMNIHAIDINSGVEILPGLKNKERVLEVQTILRSM